MRAVTVSDAVAFLRPSAEFVMHNDDVESIVWHTDGVEPLTQAEVDATVARLETEAEAAEAQAASDRQAAIDHAKSLGFTDAMIAVMYPGLAG